MQHPDPSEELGQPIALVLVENLADCADVVLEKAWKKSTGISIALALTNGMVFILILLT